MFTIRDVENEGVRHRFYLGVDCLDIVDISIDDILIRKENDGLPGIAFFIPRTRQDVLHQSPVRLTHDVKGQLVKVRVPIDRAQDSESQRSFVSLVDKKGIPEHDSRGLVINWRDGDVDFVDGKIGS